MGNAAGSMELPLEREIKTVAPPSATTAQQKQSASPKLPMPEEEELEERFNAVLNLMNLQQDKVKLLCHYDNEKKWELICDQERFQVKNPPSAYVEKLRSYVDQGRASQKFKRRIQESTQVLRELEISLRTNHIGWAQEFLNEENQGLDVLLDYLSFAQCAVTYDLDTVENGSLSADKTKTIDKSVEDLSRSASNSPTHSGCRTGRTLSLSRKALRNSRIISQKDDVHVCIMCLRAIMNYQSGFNLVMSHPRCVNEITLSLNNKNPRTKTLVLELLAAICLVMGGHDIILSAFNNFKHVCGEIHRFEKLMEYFKNEDSHIDFMVACMQFINIVVHSVENMNFRVHLQYEFTHLGLDENLEKLKFTESDRLLVQIQAYLENVFDVGALLEDAETKNALLEHVEELQESNNQLSSRLQETESEAMEKVAQLEKQLIQATKEVELLKNTLRESFAQVMLLQQRERDHELEWERAKERAMEWEHLLLKSSEFKLRVQQLQERGLLRLEQSDSGTLDIQVVSIGVEEPMNTAGVSRGVIEQTTLVDGPVISIYNEQTTTPAVSSPLTGTVIFPPPPPPPPPSNGGPPPPPPGSGPSPFPEGLLAPKNKKPVQTKYRMPLFNWQALKPNQISGTVFKELDDEHVLEELNMDIFEEQFKTKAQEPPVNLGPVRVKVSQKASCKVSLIEPNRAKNLAITLRKGGMSAVEICTAIEMYDQQSLGLDFLELLERFIPSEYELKLIKNYEQEGHSLGELSEEDQFMMRFGKIPRLTQRINTLTFMGNFTETVHLLQPLNAIIAASMSLKSSSKLKKIFEIILAFGNFMNSSKRGAAYGFRLQSLDLLVETKSTDRQQTLLHFIADIIQRQYPQIQSFYSELHYMDKAALVSLDSIILDVRSLERGMDVTRKEFAVQSDSPVLKDFLKNHSEPLDMLVKDSKTAKEVYDSVVEYFGENPKMTPPSMFFPVFERFVKAYKQAQAENEQRKNEEAASNENGGGMSKTKAETVINKMPKMPHVDLIAELKKRQVKTLVREGKDGAIEDIITDLRNQPYRRTDGSRRSSRSINGQQLLVSMDISL